MPPVTRRYLPFVRLGLLAAWLAVPASPARAAEPAAPDLWKNIACELAYLPAAPCHASWEGYALTAAFGAALAAALRYDTDGYAWTQAHRTPWQDKVMPPVTLLGDAWLHLGGYAALYQFGSAADQRAAAMAVEGQAGVAVVSLVLKAAFTSPRPDASSGPQQRRWFTLRFSDASFPSGHAMTAFCGAAILGDAYHAEWLTYPLAALVAYSRVYTQRHFPADVVAGAGLGVLIGQAVLACHARTDSEPAVHFTLDPGSERARVEVTWHY